MAATLIFDGLRRSRLAATRALLFLAVYLSCETAGIALTFAVWIASGACVGLGRKRFIEWNFHLQKWWASALWNSALRIFGARLVVEGNLELNRGPLILFTRHASLPDVILPSVLFTLSHGLRIRHIMKREVLWDPCLDIVGNRVPNCFITRDPESSKEDLARVGAMMGGLTERDGVVIFPEGTRFTPEKRAQALAKLAEKGGAIYEKARALRNVLPPRPGGSLALLERNEGACAVFCAHVGFETTKKFFDFVNGSLIGRTIRVRLWKIPFEEIPREREARIRWLYENWARIDEWIERQKSEERGAAPR